MTVVRPSDPVTQLADAGAIDVAGSARDPVAEAEPEVRFAAGSRGARSAGREVHRW